MYKQDTSEIEKATKEHPVLKHFDWRNWTNQWGQTSYYGFKDELELRIWKDKDSSYSMNVIFNGFDKESLFGASDTKLVFRSYSETIEQGLEELDKHINLFFKNQLKLYEIWRSP